MTAMPTGNSAQEHCAFGDLPTSRLHYLAATGVFGGVISDGYSFGSIGAVLPSVSDTLKSTVWDVGAIGSGTLFGLLSGCLFVGIAADRFGRKPLLCIGMALAAVISILQGFVTSSNQLISLRFLLGIVLAADYVAGASYQSEFSRTSHRTSLLSAMMLFWGIGFALAYQIGFLLCTSFTEGWRWCLMLGALPTALTCALRLWLPESPLWLHAQTRTAEAARIILRHFPRHKVVFPEHERSVVAQASWRVLFSKKIGGRVLIAITVLLGQIVPYFLIGIFLLRILSQLGIKSPYVSSVIYTFFIIIGSFIGVLIMNRIKRRDFIIFTFLICGIDLLLMASGIFSSPVIVIVLFSIFAAVISAASCAQYVYFPELFPVGVRTSAQGLAQSTSRIFAAMITLTIPRLTQGLGIDNVLYLTGIWMLAAGFICWFYAPETRGVPV